MGRIRNSQTNTTFIHIGSNIDDWKYYFYPWNIPEWTKLAFSTINAPSVETFKDRSKTMSHTRAWLYQCISYINIYTQTGHISHKEILLINYSETDKIQINSPKSIWPTYVTHSSWIWVTRKTVVKLVQVCIHNLTMVIFQLESVTYTPYISLNPSDHTGTPYIADTLSIPVIQCITQFNTV